MMLASSFFFSRMLTLSEILQLYANGQRICQLNLLITIQYKMKCA